MKIVYLWKNGQPIIVESNEDDEYIYPKENWTENKPPQGIILPCYFDGQKWIGQSRDDFENSLSKTEIETDARDLAIAQLTTLVASLQEEITQLKQNVVIKEESE